MTLRSVMKHGDALGHLLLPSSEPVYDATYRNDIICYQIGVAAQDARGYPLWPRAPKLYSWAGYRCARPIPPSLTSGLQHTAGPYR
jgi:hypothetical protein